MLEPYIKPPAAIRQRGVVFSIPLYVTMSLRSARPLEKAAGTAPEATGAETEPAMLLKSVKLLKLICVQQGRNLVAFGLA